MPAPFTRRLRTLAAVARTDAWWENKLPCLLGTAYALAYYYHLPVLTLRALLAQILVSFVPGAAFVCVINDITDLREDQRAGKRNRMAGRSATFQAAALGGCLLAGVAAGWRYRADPLTLALYVANWLAFALYSAPPFRLKTKGAWGVMADAFGGQSLPTMWIASYVAESTGHVLDGRLGMALGCWGLALGLRGILCHQLHDAANDRQAGVGTLVARRNLQAVRRFVAWGCFPVEMAALFCVLLRINAPLAWPLLALHLFFEAQRMDGARLLAEWKTPIPERSWPLAEYYKWFYPMTFLLTLAWREPAAWILVGVQIVLFRHCSAQVARDLFRLVRTGPAMGLWNRTGRGAA